MSEEEVYQQTVREWIENIALSLQKPKPEPQEIILSTDEILDRR